MTKWLTGLFEPCHTEDMSTTEVETPAKFTSEISGRPTIINWAEAKEYYLSDSKVTLNQVADKYGVAYKTVQKWSAKQGWKNARKNSVTEQGLEASEKRPEETVEEINQRHIDLYLQMQGFIKTNIAIAQDYVREEYLEAKRNNRAVNKHHMFSAQNVKYLMEALKISVDGERVAEGISITGPTKSEKDIKVSATMAKYEPAQIEAMFSGAQAIVEDMKEQTQREFIEAESGQRE